MRGVSRHRASMPNRNDLCNQGFDPLSIIDNQVILLQFGGKRGSLYCEDILRSLRSGLTPRPADAEGRAFAGLRPHLDRPTVRDHDLLRDEQPKTEPGCALRRGGSPAESIEDMREQHLRNGGSLIVDLHPDLSVGAAQGDGDRRPRLAMHDRVRHQVRDHLAGALRIEPAVGPPLGRAAQLYARMDYLQVVENLVTEREQITLTGRDGLRLALPRARVGEQVAHQV